MPEVGEVAFELERFGWSEPGQLEVVGRWSGLEGRRLGRPVLTVEAGGRRRRLTALPGGQLAGTAASGERPSHVKTTRTPSRASCSRSGAGSWSTSRRRAGAAAPRPTSSLERLHEERLRREAAEATLAERDAELVEPARGGGRGARRAREGGRDAARGRRAHGRS